MGKQGSYFLPHPDGILVTNLSIAQEYLHQCLDFNFTKDEVKEDRAAGGSALKDQACVTHLHPNAAHV